VLFQERLARYRVCSLHIPIYATTLGAAVVESTVGRYAASLTALVALQRDLAVVFAVNPLISGHVVVHDVIIAQGRAESMARRCYALAAIDFWLTNSSNCPE
jgi:hypothetical protein